MKKQRFIVFMIIAIMVFSFALSGCDNEKSKEKSGSDGNNINNSKLEMFEIDGIKYPKLEVKDKTIKVLSHWNENEKSYADIISRIKKAYDITVDPIKTTYTQLPTKLASLQASGDAPDIMIYYNSGFPTMFSKGMFQPIDDFIDFEDDFWKSSKEASDLFKWNNKTYMVAGYSVARFCWYNKSLFERYGLKTPLEEYNAGNWTWDTAINAAAELTDDTTLSGNINQFGMAGDFISHMFVQKDTNYVTMENGKLINQVKSPALEEIFTLAYDITNTKKVYTWDWQSLFRTGSLAMVFEGHWIAEGDAQLTEMIKSGDIGIAPAPNFISNDKKLTSVEYMGYLIPTGAKNVSGAQAFIAENRAYSVAGVTENELIEKYREAGWTKEMLDVLKQYQDPKNFSPGKPTLMPGDSIAFSWEPIRLMQDANETWSQIRESLYPRFNTEIEKENSNIN